MFKPLHGFEAALAQPLTIVQDAITVDSVSACLFERRIPAGDHTWLVIQQIGNFDYEVVKATGIAGNVISILRAQEGTVRQAFPAGANAVFVFTTSAIEEIMLSANLGEITLVGEGIVTVEHTGPNTYVISAPEIDIVSDSPDILVGGEFPNFTISAPTNLGCCDDTPTTTPS